MPRSCLIIAGLVAALAASPLVAQEATVFGDKLGTVPVSNANRSKVSGTGQVTANLSGSTLTIEGTFEDLSAPATGVAVYAGKLGEQGAAEVATLEADNAESGSFNGTIEVSADQMEVLQASGFSVVVLTEPNPGGEIRAWLVAGNAPSN